MPLHKDHIFRIVVYCISIYLILIKNSISINICGWIILISHLYKDIENLTSWPEWCELCGMILAGILIYSGIKIENYFIVLIGLFKLLAHIRQCILQDNCYYYN